MRTFLKHTSLFDICFRILLILLPFTTILSVWTREKFWISGISFYKEWLLWIMFLFLIWQYIRWTIKIKLQMLDIVIFAYIASLIIVSLFTTGIPGIIYGWRYDFAFLIAFWIIWHGVSFLKENTGYYIRLFLISAGVMLFLSSLLKWPLTEDMLLYFGYCGNPSNWQACNGVPPIFHGIDGANVRRFQGMLDGPNTMWAFLILFAGIFAYYMRMKKDWYFVTGGILLGIVILIVYTYSRSALLGTFAAMLISLVWSMRILYKKYRFQMLVLWWIIVILWVVLSIKYSGHGNAIIGREGSTKWHLERMITSIERFREHPLGQWLGSSGPAYRHIIPVDASNMEEKDRFYIPESWYIQQFVEGWVISGILFLLTMLIVFIYLMQKSAILGGMFAGIWVMNLFLHTFESSVLSLSLFLLIGLILAEKHSLHPKKSQWI